MDYNRHFTFALHTRIEFGVGATARLGEHVQALGGSRVLLVTDQGCLDAGVVDPVTDALDANGVKYSLFTELEAEPDAKSVVAGAEQAQTEGCDAVVAVGGGSPLDTGKAISVMMTNPGHIRDYNGLDLLSEPGVPMIAVPTTAGTGSEVTIWAVISEKERRVKYGVGSAHMTADAAICDPQLTASLPAGLTALTGIDAFTHAMESYVARSTHPLTDALSSKAMELVAGSLRTAVSAGDNVAARGDMLLASTMAGVAFNYTRLGIVHALAMPLGAKFKIPHGDVVAILLAETMRFNALGNLQKFANIAAILGERVQDRSPRDAALASVRAIEDLCADVAAPTSLADYGVEEKDLPELASEGFASGNIAVNPRRCTEGDLVGIMRRCLHREHRAE